jgi:membrane fusion protein, multidrug efflux system
MKRYDDNIEVFSDELKPGSRVIVSGQARLLDGVAIQVVN